MIVALDIETIGNPDMVASLPEPSIDSRLKDPAKIAATQAGAKQKQLDAMGLDALTARVICWSAVGMVGSGGGADTDAPQEHSEIVPALTNEAETALMQSLMRTLGAEDARIITWNGIGFDLPMIYKRAMILGVDPGNFGAPPLNVWTKRYSADRHYDLMQIWGGWSTQGWEKLDVVAGAVLGNKKDDIDFATFPALMATEEGRAKIAAYCLQDTRLTWQLWQRFNGFLFS